MKKSKFTVDTIALKKLMLDKGIKTQLELAERTGLDRNTLGSMFSGKCMPSSKTMYILVGALDIPPEDAGKIFFADNLRNK